MGDIQVELNKCNRNCVMCHDMMFRKECQLKKSSLSQFPFGNISSLVHFLYLLQTK